VGCLTSFIHANSTPQTTTLLLYTTVQFVCLTFFFSAKSFSMEKRKLYRELNGARGIGSNASFYGARSWIDRLDLVAELSGHEGCINTLWCPSPL